jgi:glycosyltransferase involved in cell wall biosynthesis
MSWALILIMENKQLKLLYFVTEDWYFCSHRLALAKAALQAGFDVSVLTRVTQHGDIIRSSNISLIPLNMERGSVNPIFEINTLWKTWKVYHQKKPDLAHHVALKPVLYGGLVAITIPHLKVVNLIAGLGGIFSSRNWKALMLRPFVKSIFRILFRRANTVTIVQNREDFDLLRFDLKVPESKLKLVKGSGVNIELFHPTKIDNQIVNMALVSRLLWDKGIGEFVEAVKVLKQKGLVFNAFLVGQPDIENIASINTEQLQAWQREGYVQCLGYIEDVAQFWRNMHIAVLPSYREGLPKCLLEAASCGRPIVTTHTSGCKEIVEDGINGILVPVRAVNELAEALERLILNKSLREQMGAAGRKKVEREFSDEIVLQQTLDVYQELL